MKDNPLVLEKYSVELFCYCCDGDCFPLIYNSPWIDEQLLKYVVMHLVIVQIWLSQWMSWCSWLFLTILNGFKSMACIQVSCNLEQGAANFSCKWKGNIFSHVNLITILLSHCLNKNSQRQSTSTWLSSNKTLIMGTEMWTYHFHVSWSIFLFFIYFIFGCTGSFLLCEGFSLVAASGDYSLAVEYKLLLAVASLVDHRL